MMKVLVTAIMAKYKEIGGQLDGIVRMVEEDRYCLDISQQLMAVEAMLNRVNKEVLSAHLKHCVQEAETPEQRNEKIDEFIATLGKLMK